MSGFLAACSGLPTIRLQLGAGDHTAQRSDAALIAADEPQAVLAARDVLLAGGSAADAAVTLGLALTVTLPSRAGLGGGGVCMHFAAAKATAETLDFLNRAAADDSSARVRAGVPATARGLFALHAKYGVLPWAQVVAPAENLARFGHPVSQAFAADLNAHGDRLINDRTALTAFMTPRRQMLQAGETVRYLDLAATLGRVRSRDLDFNAPFAPEWTAAVGADAGTSRVFFSPPHITGSDSSDSSGTTGFVIADSHGDAVACVLTMGRVFGLGIMPMGTGFLLAPAPDAARQQMAPVIGINRADRSLVFAAAAAGSNALAQATQAARSGRIPAEGAGLSNMLVCDGRENATSSRCRAINDPRGAGYALVLAPRE